jgi:hypothetical protein
LAPGVKAEDVRNDYWGNLIGLDVLLQELTSAGTSRGGARTRAAGV